MALGSRNGVDRGFRRAGEPPPHNRLETPWPMWLAGALLRHAGGLHSVSRKSSLLSSSQSIAVVRSIVPSAVPSRPEPSRRHPTCILDFGSIRIALAASCSRWTKAHLAPVLWAVSVVAESGARRTRHERLGNVCDDRECHVADRKVPVRVLRPHSDRFCAVFRAKPGRVRSDSPFVTGSEPISSACYKAGAGGS